MVAKGAGTEQSHLKHLNYKTTSMGCNKTAGKSYNKSTSPEAMVTMNFIGKPESASHVEGEMVGNKDAPQVEFLIMFTGIWGLTSLKTDFFSQYFFGGGWWKATATDAFTLPLPARTQWTFSLVQTMNTCVTALFPKEVQ